jgi:L,D-peptidoglycan transpeptidase YkuD (ErfK/YbiS/YcfS/YnhG family)
MHTNTPADAQTSTNTTPSAGTRASARTVAMLLAAVLFAAVLSVTTGGGAASAAEKHCTGIESDSKVTADKAIEVKQRSTITADIYLCEKSGDRYVRDSGPYKARLGVNGTSASKREGDGKTPKGVFWMRDGFGTSSNPGLKKDWTKVTRDHVWVDGDATKAEGYNAMQLKSKGYEGESLYQPKPYKYAQVIGYNEARTPGKGSAIFLHANTDSMKTAGCVSMYESSLVKTMKWEDSTKTKIVVH